MYFRYDIPGFEICSQEEYNSTDRITLWNTNSIAESVPCLSPCKNVLLNKKIQSSAFDVKWKTGNDYSVVEIMFPDKVMVTKSELIYTSLNLGAEIGGWIGLFLGLSVLDIYDQILQLELNGFL